jgi:hypothetical protein
MLVLPNTDKDEPSRATPKSETVAPIRLIDLSESEDPMQLTSKTESAAPMRANALKASEEPN